MNNERTCGNCCFCKSESVYSTIGVCLMDRNRNCVRKGSTAAEKGCRHHLFRMEKKDAAEN